ncbi:MAG: PstS family phosphate ABC transporter substrate-binding protein [Dysgonomonas sp.]
MRKLLLFCCSIVFVLSSCSNGKRAKRTDTPTSGVAELVGDDCFAKIIQEEIDVFEGINREAYLLPRYENEVEAVNLLLKDSVRLAVLARDLTDAEKQGIRERNIQLVPRSQKIAIDGIALIINKENTDSLISIPTLKKITTGEITSWKEINKDSKLDKMTVVFDNPNSSTVRFIIDSICGDKPLYEGLNAQNNNQEVLDYVAKTPNALGIIGVNWISNPNDTSNLTFNNKIRVMMVSRNDPATIDNSYPPLAAFLALGDYPLRRDIYVVLTDLRGTLLSGFVRFLADDRGQRIIMKSGLLPATRPIRLITIKEEF